ncbi:MAG: divergent polysaccharide deacetylase family protein [Treponema sp.]|uniref:divergent polysaccharide deacetylase family protein n=1 Tax=Treponema sp. TaxID=166 RepID=UPI003FA20E64
MPEKQEKSKSAQKASPKKTPVKKQTKPSSTGASPKTRRSPSRKKRQSKGLFVGLVLFCILLAGFNVFLITKLISSGDIPFFSGLTRKTQPALTVSEAPGDTQAETAIAAQQNSQQDTVALVQTVQPQATQPDSSKAEKNAALALAAEQQTTVRIETPQTNTAAQYAAQQPTPQPSKAEESAIAHKKPSGKPATQQNSPAQAAVPKTQPAAQHRNTAGALPANPAAKKTAPAKPTGKNADSVSRSTAAQQNTQPDAVKLTQAAKPQIAQPETARTEKIRLQNKKTAAVPEKSEAVQHNNNTQPLAKPEQPKKQPPYSGNLIFVFDDAGHNLSQLEYFLRLPFPCTIAVLPGLRYSGESARRIRKAGKQVILHQPMQSVDLRIDPGPGAIVPGLTAEQIKTIVRKNLEEIWPAAGMNNHEGSLITADEYAMKAVLEVAAEKHIFFLDSRTTAKSVAAKVAKEQNMAIWERAIFIDNDKSRIAMETQIKKGLSIAKRTGSAIMIGHVFTIELAELLTEMYPFMVDEGYSLSAIAEAAQKGRIE